MYSRTRSEPPDFTVSTVHRVCSKAGLVTAPLSGEVEGLDADTPAVLLHSYQVDLAVVTDAPALMPTFRLCRLLPSLGQPFPAQDAIRA